MLQKSQVQPRTPNIHTFKEKGNYQNSYPRYSIFNELWDGIDRVQGFNKITDLSNAGTWIMATMDMGS